ncbi:MAG: FkbM family methyltransferase [Clostridia bacterium]|nr:FkbM family methyltransferase [Clostridia bacterium]
MKLPNTELPDVWERMRAAGLPLYIYGTGDGADKIIDEMNRRGLFPSGIFASDGFVRNRDFRGFHVTSYADVCRECESFAVVLAFGTSRPDVIENIRKISRERELFCPDMPVAGDTIFDRRFYRENYASFSELSDLLSDDVSRRLLSNILNYKLTGNIDFLLDDTDKSDCPLHFERYKATVDLGAYTGDTADAILSASHMIERIFAFEPEPHAYKKLAEKAAVTPQITPINAAAWSDDTVLDFTELSGRGSSLGGKNHRGTKKIAVSTRTVDGTVENERIDFIKFDVEGAEREALIGARNTICRCRPEMLVSVYHRTDDLTALPRMVKSYVPEYKLYLRRGRCIPAWELNLYCVNE